MTFSCLCVRRSRWPLPPLRICPRNSISVAIAATKQAAEADSRNHGLWSGDGELTTLGPKRVQKGADGVDGYLIFDQDGFMRGKAGRCP